MSEVIGDLLELIVVQSGLERLDSGLVDRIVWTVALAVTLPEQDRDFTTELVYVRSTYQAGC
jgi:hypothetical protein